MRYGDALSQLQPENDSFYSCSSTFPKQSLVSMTVNQRAFTIVGKGENAGYRYFLLFPRSFLSYQRKKSSFYGH